MIKDFPLLKILVLVLVFALSHTAQAAKKGYWTWNDSKGDRQYSDRPPEGVDAVFIEKNTTNSAVSAPNEGSNAASESAGADQNPGPQTMEGMPAKDPDICRQAKSNLAGLRSARVRITEPDGSKRYLTEEEKTEQKERTQKLIDFHC